MRTKAFCSWQLLVAATVATVTAFPLAEIADLEVAKGFIYIYEVPDTYTTGQLDTPLDQTSEKGLWTQSYDIDQHVYRFLASSSARTYNPSEAKLFFIPAFLARLFFNEIYIHHKNIGQASMACTHASLELITWVQQSAPYWNMTQGENHFMVFPLDHGRCISLAGAQAHQFGRITGIQASGDLVLTDGPSKSWYCYRPYRDIVLPQPMESTLAEVSKLTPPLSTKREISVLYRFGPGGSYGTLAYRNDPHNYSRSDLRGEILRQHEENPIPGAVAGKVPIHQTHLDMQNAVFCVTPNGASQHTVRTYRAILAGCIPVTFFRAFDNPWERNLGLDWSTFTVNINPDEYYMTGDILRRVLRTPARVQALQTSLARVQPMFEWFSGSEHGVENILLRELSLISARNSLEAASPGGSGPVQL